MGDQAYFSSGLFVETDDVVVVVVVVVVLVVVRGT